MINRHCKSRDWKKYQKSSTHIFDGIVFFTNVPFIKKQLTGMVFKFSVMTMLVLRNGLSYLSTNPEWGYLHFTSLLYSTERSESNYSPSSYGYIVGANWVLWRWYENQSRRRKTEFKPNQKRDELHQAIPVQDTTWPNYVMGGVSKSL